MLSLRDGSQVCCRQLKQMLGGVSLTWTQLKLFFLEPRVLRKVKNLIFLTGGRCNRLCTGGIMRFANTNIAKSFSFFNFKAQHLLLS